MKSRYTKLLEIFNQYKKIEVIKLSEILNVSQFKAKEISYVFTDTNIPAEALESLKKENVNVQMINLG